MSKQTDVTKLSDLDIDEVSLVDRGANQHARVSLSKRDDTDELEDELDDVVDKADPDMSDVATYGDDEEGEEDEYKTGHKKKDKTSKGFFTNLVEKLFDEESTTASSASGNISDMDDVEKNTVNDPRSMQLPYGMQPQGQPAPGPQNAMPPGMQAFPGGQPQMQQPGQPPGMQQQPGQMQAGPPIPDEVIQYIQQLEQAVAAAQGGLNQPSGEHQQQEDKNVNPFGKNYDGLDEDEVSFLSELSKNLEDEETREAISKAQELVTKANTRAEEAEQIAKAERDIRLHREYVEKAKSFRNLPVDPDEFGPVLKALEETLTPEQVEMVTKALKTANDTVANAGFFSEVGKRGIDGYESISKAEGLAVEKAKEEGISKDEALSRVYEENPDLYDEYVSEHGR